MSPLGVHFVKGKGCGRLLNVAGTTGRFLRLQFISLMDHRAVNGAALDQQPQLNQA